MNVKPCFNSSTSKLLIVYVQDIQSSQDYHISLNITRKLVSMVILRSPKLNIQNSPDYCKYRPQYIFIASIVKLNFTINSISGSSALGRPQGDLLRFGHTG